MALIQLNQTYYEAVEAFCQQQQHNINDGDYISFLEAALVAIHQQIRHQRGWDEAARLTMELSNPRGRIELTRTMPHFTKGR